jgi:hypothetical protein
VFLGLVPVVGVALVLVVPAVRRLGRRTTGTTRTNRARATPRAVIAAAAGAALGVSALSAAAQRPTLLGAVVAVGAVAVLVPSLRRLLPPGGLPCPPWRAGCRRRTRPDRRRVLHRERVPAAHADRDPRLVADRRRRAAGDGLARVGLGVRVAGPPPTDLSRTTLLGAGFALLAAGLLLVAPPWGWAWLALPGWTVAGLGMGIGFSAVSFLLLHHSPEGEVGAVTAAAQLADLLTTAALIGLGGALLALLATPATALTVLLVPLTALAVLGALLAAPTATAA